MAALPLVVLAHVEQDHCLVECRGHIGDLRLSDLDRVHPVVHAVHADTEPTTAALSILASSASVGCQLFRAIHSFHRFIHRPSTGKTPFEPPNLCACWTFLWITLRRRRCPINRPTCAERN